MADSHTQSSISRNRGIRSLNNNPSKYMLFLLLFKDFSSFLTIYGTLQTLSNYSFIPSKKDPNQILVCFMKYKREIAVFRCVRSWLWCCCNAPVDYLSFETEPASWVTSANPFRSLFMMVISYFLMTGLPGRTLRLCCSSFVSRPVLGTFFCVDNL